MITSTGFFDHGERLLLQRSLDSLFHRLTAAGAAAFATGGSALPAQVARAFNHGAMRKVCEIYRRGHNFPTPLDVMVPVAPSTDLRAVCDAFVRLQEARYTADYDLSASVTFTEAYDCWRLAGFAQNVFSIIQPLPETTVFLTALLLHDRWTRRG